MLNIVGWCLVCTYSTIFHVFFRVQWSSLLLPTLYHNQCNFRKMDSTCETLPLRSASGATFARCKNAAAWPLHQLSPSSFGRLRLHMHQMG